MIVNYVSTIVFLVLMAIGWMRFGTQFTMSGGPFLQFGAWTLASIFISSSIKLAVQWEKALVFRLGKFNRTMGPGLYVLIPLLEQSRHVDIRIVTRDIPRQEAITKDNVPVAIDAVIFMRVTKPDQAVINVQDYERAILQFARSALRDVIGGRT